MADRASITTRLKRIAAFVAIVWGVAATFVGIEIVSTFTFDFVATNPLLARIVSANLSASRSCLVESEPASPEGGRRAMPGRNGAFMLGVLVGRHAAFAPYSAANPGVLAPLVAAVEQAARELGLATPPPFTARQLANANTEFAAWLEADENRTAQQIAARYSPQACHAYKLGAVWGYREVMRLSVPSDTTAFAVPIRYYAEQIPVPEQLWRSMLRASSAPAGSDELEAEGNAVTAAVLMFLSE